MNEVISSPFVEIEFQTPEGQFDVIFAAALRFDAMEQILPLVRANQPIPLHLCLSTAKWDGVAEYQLVSINTVPHGYKLLYRFLSTAK